MAWLRRETLLIVKPETVIKWHRKRWRCCWRRNLTPRMIDRTGAVWTIPVWQSGMLIHDMPDPRSLCVDDRVRFVALPDEWSKDGYFAHAESVQFMKMLIARRRSCRVSRIDTDGYPWIEAQIRDADGQISYHSWGIFESTGWIRIRRRGTS